jgi:hypothetical protein
MGARMPLRDGFVQGFDVDTRATGPNSCVRTQDDILLPPLFCPISSEGGRSGSELVSNCDACDCPRGSYCPPEGTVCDTCPTAPCSTCLSGQLCNEYYTRDRDPSEPDPCRISGFCYWPSIDYRATLTMSKCFIFCNEKSEVFTQTLNRRDDSTTHLSYYDAFRSCGLEIRATHTGTDIRCEEINRFGACGFSFECETQEAYVRMRCSNRGFSYYLEDLFPVTRGETVTRFHYCQVGFSELSLFAVDVTRDAVFGTVSCGTPRLVSGATGNEMRVTECI